MKLSHRNQGSVLLAKTGKTQAEIAARVDASRSVVAYWLSGARVPRLESRSVMWKVWSIPIEAWDLPATSSSPLAPATRATTGIVAMPPGQGELSVRAKAMQLEAMVHELLSRVREDPATSDLEKFKCMNSAAATLNLLGKLTGQTQEVNEARTLRLPAWQRIQDVLVRDLSPWPEALRAVGEGLQRLGGEMRD